MGYEMINKYLMTCTKGTGRTLLKKLLGTRNIFGIPEKELAKHHKQIVNIFYEHNNYGDNAQTVHDLLLSVSRKRKPFTIASLGYQLPSSVAGGVARKLLEKDFIVHAGYEPSNVGGNKGGLVNVWVKSDVK
jgi:hypothetical protein